MRSKMLGLAIALSTFGLGVAATTLWIAYTTPAPVDVLQPPMRNVLVAVPAATSGRYAEEVPCTAPRSALAGPVHKLIYGGVLNGKAISEPSPNFPALARSAGASGTVVVGITVDECGRVAEAYAVTGPALLQQAAVDAALNARFPQTLLSGQPVRVKGTLTYQFLLQ